MSEYAKGGIIPASMKAIAGKDGPETIIPLRAWDRAHENVRLFDAASLRTVEPNFPALHDFVTPLLRQMADRQAEQQANLPEPPEGFRWVLITEWPRFDIDGTNEYKVTWRWVIRAIDDEGPTDVFA